MSLSARRSFGCKYDPVEVFVAAAQHARADLAAYGRRFPNVWRDLDKERAQRGKRWENWEAWYFLPFGAVQWVMHGYAEADTRFNIINVTNTLTSLAAWRATQGIYIFDPHIFDALWHTGTDGDIPTEILYRLPEWCVYIPTPCADVLGFPLRGFYASLNRGLTVPGRSLNLMLDVAENAKSKHITIPIDLGASDIGSAIRQESADFLKHIQEQKMQLDETSRRLLEQPKALAEQLVAPLVSLVLYLCSEAAEMRDPNAPKRLPTNPRPTRTKTGERIFPPTQPTRWEVAFRLGANLRLAQTAQSVEESTGTHGSPRPHIRRAHWHTYRTGSRAEPAKQVPVLRWLPPIPVNVDDADALIPTAHKA
jgi:hypothetical protein